MTFPRRPARSSLMPFSTIEALESRHLLSSSGLLGEYFDRPSFSGTRVAQRDSTVDFDFGRTRPVEGLHNHSYSIRWSGTVRPEESGKYTFFAQAQGDVQLWVNGKRLVHQADTGDVSQDKGRISLKANKEYDLRLEYVSHSGDASIRLLWKSDTVDKQVVPASALGKYDKRFAVIGDYGEASQGEADVARLVDSWDPNFIITTGDNNYTGSMDVSVGQYYQEYIGKYQGAYGDGASKNAFFPSLGNHDWDEGVDEYTSFLHLPDNERYYDFVRGPVHFFAIDSDHHEPDGITSDSKQARWLRKGLKNSDSQWNVVYFHHPAFSSSSKHGSTSSMQWPFEKWGADIVLSGHDHTYERIRQDDVTYFVNGLGGADRYSFGTPLQGSQARYNADFGAMRVNVSDTAMTLEFLNTRGKVIDSDTARKRPHPESANATPALALALNFGPSRSATDLFSNRRIEESSDDQPLDDALVVASHSSPDENMIAV